MLDAFATQTVVAWYNHLLQREDWARAALAAHAGRSARIDAGLAAVFLAVTSAGTLAAGSGEPSVAIRLDPAAFPGALFDPAAARRNLLIEGDAAFAQALTDVLQKLRPDPAEDLARWIGDAPAQRLVGTLQAALDQLGDAARRAARQGADYLVAENPLVLGRQEFDAFGQALAELATRIDALAARIAALAPPGSQRPSRT